MGATIKDVANLAGVSATTVSRVINDDSSVTEKVRKRVREAIDELGYIPNPAGRLLRSGGINSIMVILPYKLSSFYGKIISAMTQEAMALNYTLLISACNNDKEYEQTVVKRLIKDVVKGVVFLGTFSDRYELDDINRQMPAVLCCEPVEKCELLTVICDYKEGVKIAVEKMLEAGHRHIGYISLRHRPESSKLKMQGFRELLSEHGIEHDEDYIFYGSHSLRTGYSAMRFFSGLDNPPTAVFAETDTLALGALNYAMQAGMNIGEDIVISGFDDIDVCEMGIKKLSSVHQPLEEIGRTAIRSLIEIIEKKRENKGVITLPVTMSLRETLF